MSTRLGDVGSQSMRQWLPLSPPPPPIVPQHRQTGGYCRCTALSEFWCTRPGVTLSTALLGTVVVHFLHSAPRLESISTKQTHMSLVYISYSLA